MQIFTDMILVLCNIYFIFNAAGPSKAICEGPLSKDTFYGKMVLDFCEENNPSLCARPDWIQAQCCIDSYILFFYYIFTMYVILKDKWFKYKTFMLLYLGGYFYSVLFQYILYYTYEEPPSRTLAFYASEVPYSIGMLLTLYKTLTSTPNPVDTQFTIKPILKKVNNFPHKDD